MFRVYNKKGPLYILINKNDPLDKYQFHFESQQFMDKNDTMIDINKFIKDNPNLKNYFRKIVDKTYYHNWIFCNIEDLDYNTCLEAIRKDGYAIKYIPDKLKTSEMCLEAVRKLGWWGMRYVPKKLKDQILHLNNN